MVKKIKFSSLTSLSNNKTIMIIHEFPKGEDSNIKDHGKLSPKDFMNIVSVSPTLSKIGTRSCRKLPYSSSCIPILGWSKKLCEPVNQLNSIIFNMI